MIRLEWNERGLLAQRFVKDCSFAADLFKTVNAIPLQPLQPLAFCPPAAGMRAPPRSLSRRQPKRDACDVERRVCPNDLSTYTRSLSKSDQVDACVVCARGPAPHGPHHLWTPCCAAMRHCSPHSPANHPRPRAVAMGGAMLRVAKLHRNHATQNSVQVARNSCCKPSSGPSLWPLEQRGLGVWPCP